MVFIRKQCAIHFCREIANQKKNSLNKQKHGYLIHTWSDKAFKAGTVVNRATWVYAYSPLKKYKLESLFEPETTKITKQN